MNAPPKALELPEVGAVIAGKYRVDGTLGSGGMGVVLAATHLDLDRRVAVKVLRAEPGDRPGAVQRLLREAKLAAQLESEHVCRVLDVGTLDEGAPYIVMEHLEGADLAALLAQDGVFDRKGAVDLLLEACEALAEAHTAGVVHRDLKPGNLFLTRRLDGSSKLKVLDFGISKQLGVAALGRDLTNPSAALGSPYYMAPEQMLSARDVDCRADIWAIGAISFELLTGARPFDGQTLPEVCAAVLNTPPRRIRALRPELPEGLAAAVDRCLQKDPARRFADVAQLAAALSPFGSDEAELSRQRIERIVESRAALRPAAENDAAEPSEVAPQPARLGTLTAGAASAAVGSEAARPRRGWAGAAAALIALGLAAALWTQSGTAPRSSAPPANGAAPPAARVAPPPPVEPTPAAPQAQPGTPAPQPEPKATDSAERPGAPAPRPAQKAAPAASSNRQRTARGRTASAPAPSASSPAPAASAPDAATRAPVDAWDPSTFGPRR